MFFFFFGKKVKKLNKWFQNLNNVSLVSSLIGMEFNIILGEVISVR